MICQSPTQQLAVERGSAARLMFAAVVWLPCPQGQVYGKPVNQGITQLKPNRNHRAMAEERVGRKIGGLRVLNSYWVNQVSTAACSVQQHPHSSMKNSHVDGKRNIAAELHRPEQLNFSELLRSCATHQIDTAVCILGLQLAAAQVACLVRHRLDCCQGPQRVYDGIGSLRYRWLHNILFVLC